MSRDGINYDADYYATLEVGMDASLDEIKDAYRRLAKIHHPDMNKGSSESTMRFKAINEAFGVLISPEKRNRYNITYRGVKKDVVVPIKKKKSKEERVKDSEFNFTIDVEVGEVDLWNQVPREPTKVEEFAEKAEKAATQVVAEVASVSARGTSAEQGVGQVVDESQQPGRRRFQSQLVCKCPGS